ncbi:MAG TPA: hypothetical protein VH951_00055 [Dehalococcoidia bacterium]|jgi:hypothetical protein
MHDVSARPYGWTFLLMAPNGVEEIFTLDSLDRQFQLGLRGSTWEASVVAKQVARITRAHVEASYNGVKLAEADPFGW